MSNNWKATPQRGPGAPKLLNPYSYEKEPLSDDDVGWLSGRFNVKRSTILENIEGVDIHSQCYVLPYMSPDDRTRGHVLRQPWDDTGPRKVFWAAGPKAMTYTLLAEPVQGWYGLSSGFPNFTFVVEDQMSAMRLGDRGFRAVALLGKPDRGNLHADRIREIAHVAGKGTVVVALDADALAEAFLFVHDWGSAFAHTRIMTISRDIKDMTDCELEGELAYVL